MGIIQSAKVHLGFCQGSSVNVGVSEGLGLDQLKASVSVSMVMKK